MDLKRIADLVRGEASAAHRGVVHLRDGDFLVFGNDGYNRGEQAKREVASVREQLAGRGEELGLAVTDDGHSWVLAVRFREGIETEAGREFCRSMLTLALWRGWIGMEQPPEAESFEPTFPS